jgi:hypothetical protein
MDRAEFLVDMFLEPATVKERADSYDLLLMAQAVELSQNRGAAPPQKDAGLEMRWCSGCYWSCASSRNGRSKSEKYAR